jgi:hypothetical protein
VADIYLFGLQPTCRIVHIAQRRLRLHVPEVNPANLHPNNISIWSTMFLTIACGAVSAPDFIRWGHVALKVLLMLQFKAWSITIRLIKNGPSRNRDSPFLLLWEINLLKMDLSPK